jgi:hypothetical protein
MLSRLIVLEDMDKLDCYDAVLMVIFRAQEMKVVSDRVLAHLAGQGTSQSRFKLRTDSSTAPSTIRTLKADSESTNRRRSEPEVSPHY